MIVAMCDGHSVLMRKERLRTVPIMVLRMLYIYISNVKVSYNRFMPSVIHALIPLLATFDGPSPNKRYGTNDPSKRERVEEFVEEKMERYKSSVMLPRRAGRGFCPSHLQRRLTPLD